MKVHYIEIVTDDVEGVCAGYETSLGLQFNAPDTLLGNARTADLQSGTQIGVRAPMAETEAPTIRPYFLVDNIESAVKKAEDSGALIALPSMDIPGRGKIAIYIQGEVQHGLWQLDK